LILAVIVLFRVAFPLGVGGERVKNFFAFYLLHEPPRFYYLVGEKNGRELLIKRNDTLLISYKDELVFSAAVTDSIGGKGISVTIDGLAGENCLGKTWQAKTLIDQALSQIPNPKVGVMESGLRLRVKYRGREIATVPIQIDVSTQDLLRFAAETENIGQKIEYLEKLLATGGEVKVERLLAEAYMRAKRYKEAAHHYLAFLKHEPQDMAALNGLARCYRELGRWDLLAELYGEMGKINPKDAMIFAARGEAYGKMGKWDKAIENLKEAVRLAPDKPEVRASYAVALEKVGRIGEVLGEYERAVKLDPKNVNLRALYANARLKAKDYEGAIREYQAVVKLDPQNAAAYASLAAAYGAHGDRAKEVENYEKAVRLSPGNPTLHYNLAVALSKAGRWSEAERVFQKVLALSPGDMDTLLQLADGALRAKHYREAARYYGQVLKKNPGNAQIYINAAYVYEALHDERRAAVLYEQAISKGAQDAQVYYHLYELYSKMGKKAEGIRVLERLVKANPQSKAMNILIDYYVKEKRFEDALRIGKRMVSHFPRQAQSYVGLARIYRWMGKVDEEIGNYREALKYEKEDDTIYLALAQACEKKGLYEEALKAYKMAFELNPNSPAAEKIRELKVKVIEKRLEKQEGTGK